VYSVLKGWGVRAMGGGVEDEEGGISSVHVGAKGCDMCSRGRSLILVELYYLWRSRRSQQIEHTDSRVFFFSISPPRKLLSSTQPANIPKTSRL